MADDLINMPVVYRRVYIDLAVFMGSCELKGNFTKSNILYSTFLGFESALAPFFKLFALELHDPIEVPDPNCLVLA